MTEFPSSPRLITTLLETAPDTLRLATCPLCHTWHASLTDDALQAGADWRCLRCGQRWDTARLAAVAAYAAWAAEHEIVERTRGSAATQKVASFVGNPPRNAAQEHGDAILTWDDEGGGSSSITEPASLSATV